MSLVSVHPCVGRRSLEEQTAAPYALSIKADEQDEDVESTAPSSPCSVYSEHDNNNQRTAAVVDPPTTAQPYLCTTSPFSAYPHLTTTAVTEFRITDNSHSHSNPAQRKKGGCKSVQLTLTTAPTATPTAATALVTHTVAGKCDVRKSFSNRSFSKYYNRGQHAVIPLTPTADTLLIIEEAQRGRDGKHFVAMEHTCVPPYGVDDKRRHPLLAFAADAVYRVSVLTRPGSGEVCVDVKCQFPHGSVTLSNKKVSMVAATAESRKRQREVKVEREVNTENEQEKDTKVEDNEERPVKTAAGKRRRRRSPTPTMERINSFDSTESALGIASPTSPFSTTDSLSSSPSYPSSPFTSSTASPSPPSSPSPFMFHLNPPTGCHLVDDLELKALSSTGGAAVAMGMDVSSGMGVSASVGGVFMPSPLLAPLPVWPTAAAASFAGNRLLSPGGLLFSPWRGGAAWLGELDEFVL